MRVDQAVAFADSRRSRRRSRSTTTSTSSATRSGLVLGRRAVGRRASRRGQALARRGRARPDDALPRGRRGGGQARTLEREAAPTRRRPRQTSAGRGRGVDGRRPLPRGAQPGAAGGDAARRARVPDGRGHRRLQRRLQGHRGPAGGVRRAARARHADLREHDRRHGRRRRDDRAAAGCRADDDQLLAARDRPDRQLHGDDPLHVRRPGECTDGRADAAGRRPPARPDALALPRGDVPARTGHAARRPVHSGRREGPAEGGDPRRQPGHLHRARVPVRPARRRARRRRPRHDSGRPRSGARAPT